MFKEKDFSDLWLVNSVKGIVLISILIEKKSHVSALKKIFSNENSQVGIQKEILFIKNDFDSNWLIANITIKYKPSIKSSELSQVLQQIKEVC